MDRNFTKPEQLVGTTLRGIDNPELLLGLGFKSTEAFVQWLENQTVLNLGAGVPQVEYDLSTKYPNLNTRLVAMEPKLPLGDEKKLETIKNDPRISMVSARWEKNVDLPFPDGYFSRIFSSFAFPFYENNPETLRHVFKELFRVLSDDGEIRMTLPGNKIEVIIDKTDNIKCWCNISDFIDDDFSIQFESCTLILKKHAQ